MLRRTLHLVAATSIVGFAIVGAGCGSATEQAASAIEPSARLCPMVTPENPDRGDRLDTSRLLGLKLKDARQLAGKYHCGILVVPEDRDDLDDSLVVDESAIEVEINDGVVTEILPRWMLVLNGVLVTMSGVVVLRGARRRGISWHWPASWRELRERESQSTSAPSTRH